MSSEPTPPTDRADAAQKEALEQLMAPLAALCLARGLGFAAVEEMLKRAFVEAARSASSVVPAARDISRISTATGLTRREVTRITLDRQARSATKQSPATQIFTRWMGDRRLHDRRGEPRRLKRQGAAPSFEALAQSVTRDVHPRTLLEEICRLGLATFDERTDTVALVRDSFAPSADKARTLGFLGHNVGDHLAAAVANVLSDTPPHLEQAVFADGLTRESTRAVRALVTAQWKDLLTALVPKIQALVDADADADAVRPANQRVRIGLYSYHAPMRETNDPQEPT